MASSKNLIAYASTSSLTCSLASLASGSTRESAVFTNTVSLNFDAQVQVTFTLASGSPSTTGPQVNIYANASLDASVWPIIGLASGATKSTGAGDASIGALNDASPGVQLIGIFSLVTTTTNGERTFRTQPFSIAAAYNNSLPEAFSLMIENITGVAFSTSTVTTANYVEVTPIYSTSGN